MTIVRISEETPLFNVVDIVEDAIDEMRQTNTIKSYSYDSGVYTIISSNTLSVNEYVNIDSSEYKVLSATSSQFTISGEEGINFTDKTFISQWPYYEHGHLLEIIDTISGKKGTVSQFKKFPLIALAEDISAKALKGIFQSEYTLNILMLTSSDLGYKAAERYNKSFDPVLTPIYERFIEALKCSNKVHNDNNHFEHEPIYRLYYGKTSVMGNISSIFNQPVDAIEIRNLKLKVFKNI